MGISTDADLYYGIQLEEGIESLWADNEKECDWEELYCAKLGVNPPEKGYSDTDPTTKDEYSKYWETKRNMVKNSLCKIGMHCSYDYPMYYITITESCKHARRGYPIKIPNGLVTYSTWDLELQRFCKVMGIAYEQPSWWLSSMWG